jgi:hypothetical protein
MALTIPRTLLVTAVAVGAAALGAAALSACTPCPRADECYYDLQQNPDGGNPLGCYRRTAPDGAVTCTATMCPPVPAGCPVA